MFYLDIGQRFLDADGKLSKDIAHDLLHLSAKGYEIWAEAIEPTVSKLVREGKTQPVSSIVPLLKLGKSRTGLPRSAGRSAADLSCLASRT